MSAAASHWINSGAVVVVSLGLLAFLSRRRIRRSTRWRATVTPLASIVGSGFLIVAPLLGFEVGNWALAAITVIVLLAYGVGSAIRYNILHIEDDLDDPATSGGLIDTLRLMERIAKAVLSIAYVIAVIFYLDLLGAFVLRLFDIVDPLLQKTIASVILVLVGGYGAWRGLRGLEKLEQHAVDIKLAVIGGLLAALVFYNGNLAAHGQWRMDDLSPQWQLETVRHLLGTLLIVQGFETSRYLRGAYEAPVRVRTMRLAQWISAAIYLAFVALATVLLGTFKRVDETGIIDLSARVAVVLPVMLVLGAVMSQFSAAIADTIASGGLVEEVSRGRIRRRVVYAAVATMAVLVLWSVDIFGLVAYASRAFAAYYAFQCAIAATHVWSSRAGRGRAVLFTALAVVMAAAALFALPVERTSAGR